MAASKYYTVQPKQTEAGFPDGTESLVVERDKDSGEVTSVPVGKPTKLTAEQKELVEKAGFKVESSSAKEAEEAEENESVSAQVAEEAQSPVVGNVDPQDRFSARSVDQDESK